MCGVIFLLLVRMHAKQLIRAKCHKPRLAPGRGELPTEEAERGWEREYAGFKPEMGIFLGDYSYLSPCAHTRFKPSMYAGAPLSGPWPAPPYSGGALRSVIFPHLVCMHA